LLSTLPPFVTKGGRVEKSGRKPNLEKPLLTRLGLEGKKERSVEIKLTRENIRLTLWLRTGKVDSRGARESKEKLKEQVNKKNHLRRHELTADFSRLDSVDDEILHHCQPVGLRYTVQIVEPG
jgi:hypothetical protein